MTEAEMLGRLAAVEQLAVIALGIVIAADRSGNAVEKAAHILNFAAADLAKDRGMRADVRKEAMAAFDDLASRVSESLRNLKPGKD